MADAVACSFHLQLIPSLLAVDPEWAETCRTSKSESPEWNRSGPGEDSQKWTVFFLFLLSSTEAEAIRDRTEAE